METPKVSIITPSYNQGKFLEDTILSVLAQDYQNIEYIIIDGNSTDNSVEILKEYSERLSYWTSEPDNGQTHAIIKGLKIANGEYFTWLCSDDILEPSAISISVEFMNKYPDVGVTFGDRIRIDSKGNILGVSNYSFRKYYLKLGLTLPQETVLIRRKFYNQTEGLDENLHMAMDFDLWCKMNKVAKIKHIPAILGRFRSYPQNKSSVFTGELKNTKFKKGYSKEFSEVYKKYYQKAPSFFFHKYSPVLRKLNYIIEKRSKRFKNDVDVINLLRNR